MLSHALNQTRRVRLARSLLPVLAPTAAGGSTAFTTTEPSRVVVATTPTVYKSFRSSSTGAWKGVESSMSRLGGSWKEPGQKRAWQADQDTDIQRVTVLATIHELTQQQVRTIEKIVPWFLQSMPASYFRQVPESFRQDHLRAISAIKDANMDLHLNLKSRLPDGRQVYTFIRPGTEPGLLLSMIKDLPHREEDDVPLSRIHVFSTRDETMSLNMFVYGHDDDRGASSENVELAGADILSYAQDLQLGRFEAEPVHAKPNEIFERPKLLEFLNKCNETYIRGAEPRRFLKHVELFNTVSGTESMAVNLEEAPLKDATNHYWVDIAVANSMPQKALENAAHLLFLHKFDIARAHLDVLDDGENGNVTMLRLLVEPIDHEPASDECFTTLKHELKRTKWLDPATMDLVFDRYPWLGVNRGEVITAFCSMMHPIMAKVNAMAYSKANILTSVTSYIPFASSIADLFLERFDPANPLSDEELARRSKELREHIENEVEDRTATELLHKMIDIVGHTLKTNAYHPDRYALGLRLDPVIMEHEGEKREIPYGVIFIHGRRFNGYHVRFRDIARGGLRLVTPANPEQLALESARQYDECYGLALAQQMKNKDIPEGGSKAVNLIDVAGDASENWKNFVVRKSVKAFADTILDLVVTSDTNPHMVDLVGKKEVIYLGPDEQVIPEDINWIIQRAGKRGYDTPNAFMSSKPRAGINHKVYGVTSEGVNVYLDVALRQTLGIDPTTTPFTVKITGGPDGDVAGNEIKILLREYGENARIIGIADHSGCAEDPHGLDHTELLRLVKENLSISHFDQNQLGVEGDLHLVDTKEGVIARNTMHNRLVCDAFIPAGGRPNTIDKNNYQHFLLPDGKPSAPLIVEGANLFLTSEARQALYEKAGVVIVKDSSANKGGVITSSYEICAAMLLSEDEFFENKEQIVAEVLDKLRSLCKMEALLLFREYENYPGSLPQISQIVSSAINTATDALTLALDDLSQEELDSLLPLFRAHLPPTISAIAFDERVKERVPEQYIKNAIASCLASKLVYKEGSRFIESQPPAVLATTALKYIVKEKEVAVLTEALEKVDMDASQKQAILKLLEVGGTRTALTIF